MSWGRLAAFLALALFTSTACEDDEPSQATDASASGAGGTPEQAGSNAGGLKAGGGAGSAGEAGTPAAGTPGAAGTACEGDTTLWASLTASPATCVTADDCCVVVNACLAEAQIVHADDFEAAQTAWPYCEADCTDCIPPVVRVACDNGHCVGSVDAESLDDGMSHCGDSAPAGGSPGQSFSCNDR